MKITFTNEEGLEIIGAHVRTLFPEVISGAVVTVKGGGYCDFEITIEKPEVDVEHKD